MDLFFGLKSNIRKRWSPNKSLLETFFEKTSNIREPMSFMYVSTALEQSVLMPNVHRETFQQSFLKFVSRRRSTKSFLKVNGTFKTWSV